MPLDLEVRVAQVAPQHGEHAEPVGLLERARDLDDLARGLLGAEVDRRADAGRAHLVRALDRREHDLVELVRIREQLVVVQLHDEGELVRPLAADRAEDAERRGERVAAALDRELHEVLGVEVDGVRREARGARVLDALVDRAGSRRSRCPARRPEFSSHCRLRSTVVGRSVSTKTRSTKSGPGRCRLSLETVSHWCAGAGSRRRRRAAPPGVKSSCQRS